MPAAPAKSPDLWSLVLDSVEIDPEDLLAAIEAEAARPEPDFRTRVLLRDSFLALSNRWGEWRTRSKLSQPAAAQIDQFLNESLGEKGFSSLEKRLMEQTRSETIQQFFRELGSVVREPCRMNVGGSCGFILTDLLHRRTDAVDAVNEVPAAIRTQYELIENLVTRYGLRLAHFQSHYLPDGWESRLHSFGVFDQLHVYLVDPVDILLGKLFSRREKDLDDLRATMPLVGKSTFVDRFNSSGKSLLSDPQFKQNAERNWYILFGQELGKI
jgi:hypothetical protein